MQLTNHIGEKFELRILGKQITPNNETVNWWYKSSIVITEDGKKRKTNLRFLTREDLFLLTSWLENIEQGDYNKTRFEFVDAHVWFRLWQKGKEPFLRFFIQGDKYRKYYWDWRISRNNLIFMKSYITTLKTI
jgi:hypothetical protein